VPAVVVAAATSLFDASAAEPAVVAPTVASADAGPESAPANPGTIGARTSYVIRPGDTVSISMAEDADVRFSGEVSTGGLVEVPYLGHVMLVGHTTVSAEAELQKLFLKDLYERATVSVDVIRRAPGKVHVYGAVTHPGKVDLPEAGDMTVLQAIADAGGVSTWASPRDCYVMRETAETGEYRKIMVDVVDAFRKLNGPAHLVLADGDVLFVPSATGLESVISNEAVEIIVTGQVNTPGIVSFAPGERCTLLRAILKAGSFTRFAKSSRVRLIRYGKNASREVKEIDVERIIEEGYLDEDIELLPGDLIIVDMKRINL